MFGINISTFLSVGLGAALGWAVGWRLCCLIETYLLKSPRRKLMAEIEALIHENRHQHPAIILNRIQEFLK